MSDDDIILYACQTSELQPETEELSYSVSEEGDEYTLFAEPQHGTCPATEITLYAEPSDGPQCPCVSPDEITSDIDVYWPSESEEVPDPEADEQPATKVKITDTPPPYLSHF